MTIPREMENQRSTAFQERAEMQKLFITGHLLPGADINTQHIAEFFNGLGTVCGMNIFNGPHIKTPDSYDPETFKRLGGRPPEDVNGTVMWDDSGAQLYIFPSKGNWFTLDIHTCKIFDEQRVLEYVYSRLNAGEDMQYSTSTSEKNTPWQSFTKTDNKPLNPEKAFASELDAFFGIDLSESSQLIAVGKSLENLVKKAIEDGCGERVAASYTSEQRALLREIHSRFEVAVDNNFMDDVLSDKANKSSEYPFQPRYNRLSEMEARTAGMQKDKPVLHIGTGWPGTAIGLYQQFGIPVICVEADPDVAKKSKMALEKLGLYGQDKLQVVSANGNNLNPEGYFAVILSAMLPTQDKERIIDNMRKLACGLSSDPILVLRAPPDRARSLLYQELPANLTGTNALELIASTNDFIVNDDHLKSFVYRMRETSGVLAGFDEGPISAGRQLNPIKVL